MTESEILRAAEAIVRQRHAAETRPAEREIYRNTITGLIWARADLLIAAQPAYFAALVR